MTTLHQNKADFTWNHLVHQMGKACIGGQVSYLNKYISNPISQNNIHKKILTTYTILNNVEATEVMITGHNILQKVMKSGK